MIENFSNEELNIMGKADWHINLVGDNKAGKLYLMKCEQIYDRDFSEVPFDGEKVRNTTVSYYFRVTKDSICCIDKITEEISALIENNIIPETAYVVCQKDEMEDSFSEYEIAESPVEKNIQFQSIGGLFQSRKL